MKRTLLTILFSALFFTTEAIADSEDEKQIEALKNQIEEIQKRNQRQIQELQKSIEELKSKNETKGKEENAWWNKIDAGYKDGVFIKTKDGKFSTKMRFRPQIQFSITESEDEDTAANFDIRRMRIKWDGNAFTSWFLYEIQLDATDDIILRDAYFEAAYNKSLAPKIGQYKVPFSREQLISSSKLQIVERSILDDEFAFGRDRGAGIYGVSGNHLTYGAGIFNGDGRNGESLDSNLLYAARVQFTPCCGELKYEKHSSFPTGGDYEMDQNFGVEGKLLFALSAGVAAIPGLDIDVKTPDNDIDKRYEEIFGETAIEAGQADADVVTFTFDATLKHSVFNFEGDYFIRDVSPSQSQFKSATDQGFRIQGGLFLVPNFVELAGRLAWIDFDDTLQGRDQSLEVTPGLNFYLSNNHKWKLQFSYSFIQDKDTEGLKATKNIFRSQLQAYF